MDAVAESLTIGCVPVSQQIARRRVPWKRLSHLACQPDLRWILGDLEMDYPSAVVAKNNQSVEKPECRGGDDERVDRGRIVHVVVQEAAPSWRGDLGSPR